MKNTCYRSCPKPPKDLGRNALVASVQNWGESAALELIEYWETTCSALWVNCVFSCTNVVQVPYFTLVLMYCEDQQQAHNFLTSLLFYITQVFLFLFFFLKKLSGSQSLKIQCFSLPQWINTDVIRDFFKKLMQLFKVDCFKIGVYLK